MSNDRLTVDAVIERVSQSAFGNPLITNVLRGHIVEAMIALAIEPEWSWCAGDYSSWDFERSDGLRLEVKQSAARQTWEPPTHGKIYTSFDIKERTGRWEGASFIAEAGRAAQLYVFSFNSRVDEETDHRDPNQWEFYVVRTSELPLTQRISLSRLRQLVDPVDIHYLARRIANTAEAIA